MKINKMKFKVTFTSSKEEVEKAILPALILSTAHDWIDNPKTKRLHLVKAFVLSLGWWHWSVDFHFGFSKIL